MINEKKIVAANYIIGFSTNIEQLNHFVSLYAGVLTRITANKKKMVLNNIPEEDNKNPLEGIELDDQDIELIKNVSGNIRYYMYKSLISYKTLKKIIRDKTKYENNPEELLEKINTQNTLILSDVLKYALVMNEVMTNEVISELLYTSNEYIRDIYGVRPQQENQDVQQ